MNIRKNTHTLLLFLSLAVSLSAQEYAVNDVPNPKVADANNFVSNPDGILSYATVRQINAALQSLETDTKAEVNVVMLNSIGSEDIFDFGVQLFKKWGIGKKELDNGLLILFVLDQRTVRFEVGYGLEGILPDAICKRIQMQAMIPEFKNGNYDAGILAGVELAASYIRQEPVPEKKSAFSSTLSFLWNNMLAIIIAIYLILTSIFLLKEIKIIRKIRNKPSLNNNKKRYAAYMRNKGLKVEGCMYFGVGCCFPMFGVFLLFALDSYITGLVLLSSLLTLAPLLIYQSVWKRKFRRQPVPCPSCGKEIKALPEKENSKYLDPQANMEVGLKSFYANVFLCEDCNETIIYKYNNIHSKYKKCSQCGTKAFCFKKTERTEGIYGFNRYECKYCHHTDIVKERAQSSGSSGGRFGSSSSGSRSSSSGGGGRSGGGGSSSRW